jgi:DNA-binding MarR family transcriptional regulator
MELEHLVDFDPSTCIGGKVRRIALITSNIFRKYYTPFGITDSQISILFTLTKIGNKTQRELTDITKLEKSTLNRNLKRLFEKELLSKEYFPEISITIKGKSFVNQIVPEWKKAMIEIQDLLTREGLDALNFVHHSLITKIK